MILVVLLCSYAIATAASALFLCKRYCDRLILFLPLAAFYVLIVNALVAQIANLVFQLHAYAVLFVCVNLCIACAASAWYAKRRHHLNDDKTSRSFDKDSFRILLSYLSLIAFSACLVWLQFGSGLLPNFSSTDGAVHLYFAEDAAEGVPLTGMFFTRYLSADVLLAMGYPFLDSHLTYRAFILTESFVMLIGSLLLFVIIRKACEKSLVSAVLTVLCLAGYPLNAMAFGFAYWDDGGYFILLLLASLLFFKQHKRSLVTLCAISLYGVYTTYNLFVPIGILLIIFYIVFMNMEWIKAHVVKGIVIGILFIACMIGGLATIVNLGLLDGLGEYGYCFNDDQWSFIPLIPLALYGLLVMVRRRSIETRIIPYGAFLAATIFACVIVGALLEMGVVSIYYFSKFNLVLWYAFFILAAFAFVTPKNPKASRAVLFSSFYLVLMIVALLCSVGSICTRLPSPSSDENSTPVLDSLFGVYNCNRDIMMTKRVSEDEIILWENMKAIVEEEGYFPLLGDPIDLYWYDATVHKAPDRGEKSLLYWFYGGTDEERAQRLEDEISGYSFIGVGQDPWFPESFTLLDTSAEPVFQNDAGTIYRLSAN